MVHVSDRFETTCSVDDVFAFISDVERYAEWDPSIFKVFRERQGALAVGEEWQLTVRMMGYQNVYNYVVNEVVALERIRMTGDNRFGTILDEITIAPTPSGTEVRWDVHITLKIGAALFGGIVGREMKKAHHVAMRQLQRALLEEFDG